MTTRGAGPLSATEMAVATAMSLHGYRLEVADMRPDTAMSQDAGIDGIDVADFVMELPSDGELWRQVPWERFSDQTLSFYGCQVFLVPFWLLYRLLTWPMHRGRIIPLPNKDRERLTVTHLAAVLDRGEWFEP